MATPAVIVIRIERGGGVPHQPGMPGGIPGMPGGVPGMPGGIPGMLPTLPITDLISGSQRQENQEESRERERDILTESMDRARQSRAEAEAAREEERRRREQDSDEGSAGRSGRGRGRGTGNSILDWILGRVRNRVNRRLPGTGIGTVLTDEMSRGAVGSGSTMDAASRIFEGVGGQQNIPDIASQAARSVSGSGAAAAEGTAASGTSGMMGSAAGGAMVAGPIVAGVMMARESINQAGLKFAGSIRMLGDYASAFAHNDHFGAFRGALGGMVEGINKVNPVVGAFGRVMLASADSVKVVFDSLVHRARELAQYSGPISAAQAHAEVRTVMADIREANTVGSAMSRLIDAQSRIEIAMRDAMLPLKEAFAETIAGLVPVFEDLAEFVREHKNTFALLGRFLALAIRLPLEAFIRGTMAIIEFVEPIFEALMSVLRVIKKQLGLKTKEDKMDIEDVLKELFKGRGSLPENFDLKNDGNMEAGPDEPLFGGIQ